MTNQEAIDQWSTAVDRVDDFGEEGDFARQHLLNPAIFALLGPVEGKRVLDAGCGQGYLSRLLAKRGAIVTGVEPATSWYRRCVEREHQERLGITYRQEDLSTLEIGPSPFDAVVANMVFMDIPEYEAAIRNCIRSLVSAGSLVFSLTHPCFEESATLWRDRGYVAVREYLREYTVAQGIGTRFHRPLSAYFNLVIREGCTIRAVVEPQLGPEWARRGPEYERNVHVPNFIVVHASKV